MLQEYLFSLSNKLRPRAISFLVEDEKVLLGYKKSGFGKGRYMGIGGKVEEGETIEEGTARELEEETLVKVSLEDFKKAAILRFYFPHVADESWNQEVH